MEAGARARRPAAAASWFYGARELAGDYVALTKPRVISLLLVTTLATMFVANSSPGIGVIPATMVGGYLAAGGAGAINHFIERDIDARMTRTSRRPLPDGRVEPRAALWFGIALGALSFVLFAVAVNMTAALLAIAGLLAYVFVYTMWLKPRTSQNIVIGGASGAMPPVLGWAAVTGEISSDALLLFLIIFAWTPPHFWALALYRRNEYARGGVPMLPVTHGERFTRLYVLLYTLLLAAICLLPFASGMSGAIYLMCALALNGLFVAYAVRLYVNYSDGLARRTFRYSIAYLSCLFAALLIDHYWRIG